MAANKEEEMQLKQWFINDFWPKYGGKHITAMQKGGRGHALKIIYKINPDKDKQEKMMANMVAQLKASDLDRKNGEFVSQWPMCTSYLNQNRHEDEIDSQVPMGIIRHEPHAVCIMPDCDEPVHGPAFAKCVRHLNDRTTKYKLRTKLAEIGLQPLTGESKHDYSMRCKQYYLKKWNIHKKDFPL